MEIQKIIKEMTLEEKAGLCSGLDFWHTKPVERLDVPSVMVSDGPHGLRKQDDRADHIGVNESIKAVCFPAGCATASSFDRELMTRLGDALAEECQAEGVGVILGPAINIKRSPLCGRNFEYLSEDPYLAGELAAAYTLAVQKKNIGVSLKHFAANNQEHRRMSSSSDIDERTLREIYLPPFEIAVKKAKPWTVMCSYNRINDVFSSENKWLNTDVLRDEWGFDGYVMTDWGAVADRVTGLKAGIELEMPASGGVHDREIVQAVKNGELDEKILDRACARILEINERYLKNAKSDVVWDKKAHNQLSAEIAEECMVLLKNENNTLPLEKNDSIAFIGEFAEKPRFQGGGSSHINCTETVSALDAVEGYANISYSKGFYIDGDDMDFSLMHEAVEAAQKAKVAVIFAGLPDFYESEGYDRKHMSLPECQNRLIEAVAAVNPNTVVVLHNGSPVSMPWINSVKAVLEAYLSGQAVGQAVIRLLFGDANPCGRLAESFPVKVEDNPSYLFFGGNKERTEYREGVFVGYRYYDKKKMEVLFPFGYGLSYTSYKYENLVIDKEQMNDTDSVKVSVDVKNTGTMTGKEVVQLYVCDLESTEIRPIRELKGFDKVELKPGEKTTVSFVLDKRAFAYYEMKINDWYVESGDFLIQIGSSSRDILLEKKIRVNSTKELPVHYDMNSIFMD
ncbi:MAG: glycoside hydrolase family 3 C-terminal domain-containing protein, partial [Spirochaetales bacterium]|nr:glycoside hydrolase family 3 C-terminal domain-containing protein [Spirochaetales bacterium]